MPKLHEVLAVEADKEGIAKKILAETEHNFRSKHHIFQGGTKTLKMLESSEENAALEAASAEQQNIETTVQDRLDYTYDAMTDWLDVVFQKEVTNQTSAKADLEVDGTIIARDIPATFLLGLESKLKMLRKTIEQMPTLEPGIEWVEDTEAGNGVYRSARAEVRSKTQKRPMSRVLYEATKEHPAQIEKWAEDVVVGHFTTTVLSAKLPAKEKMELMSRLDKLIQAAKQARMRANSAEVDKSLRIGGALFNYLNG